MTASAGLPRSAPQRPPMSRGKRELVVAVAALPVLLTVGVYLGGRLGDSGNGSLAPAAGIASPLVTAAASPAQPVPSPAVTVKPAAPRPVVTVKPAAPRPVVTVKPAAPRPVVTVKPAAPGPSAPNPPVSGPVVPAQPPARPVSVLGVGSSGAAVREWQEQMVRRGWRIRVDGVFGLQSERVARRFQRNKGLRVDGLVGPQTWAAAWRLPVVR